VSYTEDDLIPLSALQHLLFCERQTALIHIERVWEENRYTAEGRILHNKAHDGKPETRDGVRITRGLPLRSFTLGIVGQADVVLWKPPDEMSQRIVQQTMSRRLHGDRENGLPGWTVTPMEYKRGRPKKNDCDLVQLCAQAICLEEMLGVTIPTGQLFYGEKRRRFDVEFNDGLRAITERAAIRLHELIRSGITPPAVKEKKCETCSLLSICLPKIAGQQRSARKYFERELSKITDTT